MNAISYRSRTISTVRDLARWLGTTEPHTPARLSARLRELTATDSHLGVELAICAPARGEEEPRWWPDWSPAALDPDATVTAWYCFLPISLNGEDWDSRTTSTLLGGSTWGQCDDAVEELTDWAADRLDAVSCQCYRDRRTCPPWRGSCNPNGD